MKLTTQAKLEQKHHNLLSNPAYITACDNYARAYDKRRPCKSVPTKNMLRALRMYTWENSADDWARLHMTEAYLRF